MESLTIKLKNPKAKKLIDDLIDLDIISIDSTNNSFKKLWTRLDNLLPQTNPDITAEEINEEIAAYRASKDKQ